MVLVRGKLQELTRELGTLLVQVEHREDDGSLHIWIGEDREASFPSLLTSFTYAVAGGGGPAKVLTSMVPEAEESTALAIARGLAKHLNKTLLLSCNSRVLKMLTEDTTVLTPLVEGVCALVK